MTKLVNECELNFGIFRNVWILEMLNVWFCFMFMDGVCLCFCFCFGFCGCSWYMIGCMDVFHVGGTPQKGKIPRVHYHYYYKFKISK